MSTLSNVSLWCLLIGLILVSGFFSSSETGLMAINQYKLKHLARSKHKIARLVVKLLKRPDRLLGVILIGNTFANNLASVTALLLAKRYIKDEALAITIVSTGLTMGLLIFAEVLPKTIAATYPQKLSFFVAYPLRFFLILLYPIVWVTNTSVNTLLRLFGLRPGEQQELSLSSEELRTVVNEAGDRIPDDHQSMLLKILDLEKRVLEDILLPKSEVYGIDLDEDEDVIFEKLRTSPYARVPIYHEHIDKIEGMVTLRHIIPLLSNRESFSVEALMDSAESVYFIPEGIELTTQLLNFKNNRKRMGVVVDEYGQVQGLITLEDILEEIVGEFTTNHEMIAKDVYPQTDGSYLVDGAVEIGVLNAQIGTELTSHEAKTVSGLLIEYLECIPTGRTSLKLGGMLFEIEALVDNTIKSVRVTKV